MRKPDPVLHEQRRQEILGAAEICFADKGFHQTSMADIARGSGLSMGLLYRYFDGKEELILSSAARDRDASLSAIAEFAQSEQPFQVLGAWLQVAVEQMLDPAYARITLEVSAEAARNPRLAVALIADDQAIRGALTAALRQQQAARRIASSLPAEIAASLIVAWIEGMSGRALCEPDLNGQTYAAAMLHMLQAALEQAPARARR